MIDPLDQASPFGALVNATEFDRPVVLGFEKTVLPFVASYSTGDPTIAPTTALGSMSVALGHFT
ncbi:MAG: hypothetical protein ABIT20_14275 [Gemmatimonadaceae bacterium]